MIGCFTTFSLNFFDLFVNNKTFRIVSAVRVVPTFDILFCLVRYGRVTLPTGRPWPISVVYLREQCGIAFIHGKNPNHYVEVILRNGTE